MNANIKNISLILFCKIYFEEVTSKDLNDWLVITLGAYPETITKVIPEKKFSPTLSLAIPQFLDIIKRLKIKQPKSQEDLCKTYMTYICYEHLEGKMEILTAIKSTLKVLKESKDSISLKRVLELVTELDLVSSDYQIKSLYYSEKKMLQAKIRKRFLNYLEIIEKSKSRDILKLKTTKKLIMEKYFQNAKHDRLNILIIGDILRKRRVSEGEEKAVLAKMVKDREGWGKR